VLAEPAAAEILAKVPAAERILRPLRRMLGLGPYDPTRRRSCMAGRPSRPTNATLRTTEPAAVPAPPPPDLLPLGRLIGTSPGGFTWYKLATRCRE
jgi:hypothetical protein